MKFKGVFFILIVISIIFLFLFIIKFSGFAVQDTFSEVTIDEGIIVIYDEFDGSTTDFASINDTGLETIEDMILENTLYGKIVFNEIINLTQDVENNSIDLDSSANISFNEIEINTTKLTSLEKSATLYLYNLTFSDPRILRDGSVCPSSICTENSYSGGTFSFNVTNFTIYSAEETPSTPGGGGGGSCTYTWECTDWYPAPCPESEIQERLCVNKGTCTGTTGIPSQNRTCNFTGPTEPLFDLFVSIPLTSKIIPRNTDVEVNVELINVGKLDQLDVFFKYTVVDENNKLITELQETRAIKEKDKFKVILDLPDDIEPGTYKIFVQITYDIDKIAAAEDIFIVTKIPLPLGIIIYYLIVAILVVSILITIKLILNRLKEKKDFNLTFSPKFLL